MIEAFIVEDEKYIRKGLKVLIEELDKGVKIIGESTSLKDAIIKVDNLKPKLIFLDIKLLDGSGFDLLEKVKFKEFKVIFITSYDSYAIKALKTGAIDYILKPIDINELSQAIDKVILLFTNDKKDLVQNKTTLTFLNGTQVIDLENLIYCNSYKGYTTFYMVNHKKFLTSKPLKEYENVLLKNKFIRTHQSYFVNTRYIESFNSKRKVVLLLNNEEIPVSARKIAIVNAYLNK